MKQLPAQKQPGKFRFAISDSCYGLLIGLGGVHRDTGLYMYEAVQQPRIATITEL